MIFERSTFTVGGMRLLQRRLKAQSKPYFSEALSGREQGPFENVSKPLSRNHASEARRQTARAS